MNKIKLRKDDKVLVLSGEQKGSQGRIVKIITEQNKAIVEGVNLVKKHAKPSSKNPQGGIIEKEAPIHISNLSLMTNDGVATRVGFRLEDGKKVRFAKKNNEII